MALVVDGSGAGRSTMTEPPLTGLQPIPVKKTLMIVNSFLINTTDFLNKFAAIAEQKLMRVTQTIQRVEIILALLEGKLESVPWLTADLPPPSAAAPVAAVAAAAPAAPSPDAPPAPPMDAPPPPPPPNVLLLKDDQRYAKFFKMMRMRVPLAPLKAKAAAEGLDPDVLDMDPEGPAPEGGIPPEEEREEGDDNDDDD